MGERSPLFFFHKHKVALFRIDSGDGVGHARCHLEPSSVAVQLGTII